MRSIVLLALCVAGCAATVGTTGVAYVPKDAAATCTTYCTDVGMTLTSVVIMANNVGCVCGVNNAAPGTSAAAGGMATLLMAQQSERASTRAVVPAPHH